MSQQFVGSLAQLAPDDLTPTQRFALAALVGVDRRTLFRWRQSPEFNRARIELSREAMEAAATRPRNLLMKATHAIAAELDRPRPFEPAMRVVSCRRLWGAGKDRPADRSGDAAADQSPLP